MEFLLTGFNLRDSENFYYFCAVNKTWNLTPKTGPGVRKAGIMRNHKRERFHGLTLLLFRPWGSCRSSQDSYLGGLQRKTSMNRADDMHRSSDHQQDRLLVTSLQEND